MIGREGASAAEMWLPHAAPTKVVAGRWIIVPWRTCLELNARNTAPPRC
jgi:hypothetical protein